MGESGGVCLCDRGGGAGAQRGEHRGGVFQLFFKWSSRFRMDFIIILNKERNSVLVFNFSQITSKNLLVRTEFRKI